MHSPATRWRGQEREISRLNSREKAKGQLDSHLEAQACGGRGTYTTELVHLKHLLCASQGAKLSHRAS